MRAHWIQSDYPPQLNDPASGEDIEYILLPNAGAMFNTCWLAKTWEISIAMTVTNGGNSILDSVQISDGVQLDSGGYANEIEKILARTTTFERAAGGDQGFYEATWGDWVIIGYTAGVEVEWKLHMRFHYQSLAVDGGIWNFDDGTRVVAPDVIFRFLGEDFPMYIDATTTSVYTGLVEFKVPSGGWWPNRRADGTHPVINALDGSQIIFDPVELNIQ